MTHQSYNFHLGKVAAVFAVILGHYAEVVHHPSSVFLWIPARIGLAIFAFSSGYFTASKYDVGFSLARFWKAKVIRLLGPLLVIDAFLTGLFLWRGVPDVFGCDSFLAWFGLSGFLRLFGLPRETPFGNGLWFLTLLLLFYAAYPILLRMNRTQKRGLVFVMASFLIALALQNLHPLGVSFWETAWFFLFGVYRGRHRQKGSPVVSPVLALACLAMIPLVRFGMNVSVLTPLFIMGAGVGVVDSLMAFRLPRIGAPVVLWLSGLMLQMYVIHTYLFVSELTGNLLVDFCVSMLLIVAIAFCLKVATNFLGRRLGPLLPKMLSV